MNIFQFITSLTSSLVWPVAIVLIILLLRKTLAKLILSLQKLRLNYKDKDIELSFGDKVAALEVEAEKANIPDLTSKINLSNEQIQIEVQTEESDKLKKSQEEVSIGLKEIEKQLSLEKSQPPAEILKADLELQKISLEVEKQRLDIQNILNLLKTKDSQPIDKNANLVTERGPVGAVIIAWEQLQKKLLSFIKPLWPGTRPPNVLDAIHFLEKYTDEKLFDMKTIRLLHDMRKLRNEIAHADEDKIKISFAEALEYVRLAERIDALLSSLQKSLHEENLATMTPKEFEELIRELFSKIVKEYGGEIQIPPRSYDLGADAIVFDPDPIRGGKYIIQVKKYSANTPVSASALRDLLGVISLEKATKGFMITTSYFTKEAQHLAKTQPSLMLIDGPELLNLLKKYGYNVKIEWPKKEPEM